MFFFRRRRYKLRCIRTPSSSRRSFAILARNKLLSTLSCDSPIPRDAVPSPEDEPLCLSRCVHRRLSRGSWYRRLAISTCNFPSLLAPAARCSNMERMRAVRSAMRTCRSARSFSARACSEGLSSSSTTSVVALLTTRSSRSDLKLLLPDDADTLVPIALEPTISSPNVRVKAASSRIELMQLPSLRPRRLLATTKHRSDDADSARASVRLDATPASSRLTAPKTTLPPLQVSSFSCSRSSCSKTSGQPEEHRTCIRCVCAPRDALTRVFRCLNVRCTCRCCRFIICPSPHTHTQREQQPPPGLFAKMEMERS